MGHLVNGIWETTSTKEVKKDGQFVRKASAFRNWVTADGSPGPTGTGGFKATPGSGYVFADTIANDRPHPLAAAFTLDRFYSGALIDEHGAAGVAH